MAVTGTYTVRQIIDLAASKIGLKPPGQALAGEEFAIALDELNLMLKGWQNRELRRWLRATQTVTLTTAASYTLDPVRPLMVDSVRFKTGGIETPMTAMTADEYDSLPQKTSTGRPSTYFYDRQREAALLYVWPVLASASGETLEITYTREIEDVTSGTDVIDVPGEWWEVTVYQLASRLADTFEIDASNPAVSRTIQRAEMLLSDALAFDREGSLFFGEADEDRYF